MSIRFTERLLYQPTSTTPDDENIVAFYAYFSADVSSLGLSETLKYDVVKTNQGNGYHPSSGVFIAPKEGYYVFTWTIRLYHYGDTTAENFSTELIINGDVYGSVFLRAHLEDDDQATATVVAHVNKGEDVYVRTHSMYSSIGSIRSNTHGRSSFAGWKIN
ncbi:complement C1q-like protein 2 [Saccostrea echinata]|uniref:complement C1q-like protein 2 n=1 Tax=Saccostrea echinata TaxID=191078 RepID=UPI002A840082|nr:complement C1q-like protein 2 [Saccostrea echinata]